MVARSDVSFLPHTIPHLIRMCRYPFAKKVLVRDTAPLADAFAQRQNIGTLSQLSACCDHLQSSGLVDEIIDIDYSEERRIQIYRRHFGSDVKDTHGWVGTSIFGYIYSVETADADYLVHFDSDMLLHQKKDRCWIEQGIDVLRRNPDVLVVNPLPGPPEKDGVLYQMEPYDRDSAGFYRFKGFSSRVFLIDVGRFNRFLPLHPKSMPGGRLALWEQMVSDRMIETSSSRADLDSHAAWVLHPNDHRSDFIAALPQIIERVEAGWYPPEQAGYYDLKLGAWMRHLGVYQTYASVRNVKQILEQWERRILGVMRNRRLPRPLQKARLKLLITGERRWTWIVDLSDLENPISTIDGPADCTITVSGNDLIDLVNGELRPDVAMKHRWLRVDGDPKLFEYFSALLSTRADEEG